MPDNFDWTKLFDVTGLIKTEATPPASVSFKITKAHRSACATSVTPTT